VCVACDLGVRLPAEVEAAAQQTPPVKEKMGRRRKHPHPIQGAPLHRADQILASQAEEAWQTITWRMGAAGPLAKQFVAVRAHRAMGDWTGREGWSEYLRCAGTPAVSRLGLGFSPTHLTIGARQ
jgi:hypothetical protein